MHLRDTLSTGFMVGGGGGGEETNKIQLIIIIRLIYDIIQPLHIK